MQKARFRNVFCSVAAVLLAAGFLSTAINDARANWLSTLVREAGEAGVKAGSHVHVPPGIKSAPIGKAVAHIAAMKSAPKLALGAHLTPEGHWQFANRQGQTFTAASVREMQRVVPTLLPDAADAAAAPKFFISEESFFTSREPFDLLPRDADLVMVSDRGAFPVRRAVDNQFQADLRPNLRAAIADQTLFNELTAFLSRPLNRADMRALAVSPGGAKTIPSAPRLDAVTKAPEIDFVAPESLASALSSLRGRTAIVSGRVDGDTITFASSAPMPLAELSAAARANDVNLIVLHSASATQPGGRTWLWQKTSIDGLVDAASKQSYGDFLDSLAAKRGGMAIDASRDGYGRIRIAASPVGQGPVGDATSVVADTIGELSGNIAQAGAEIWTRDKAEQGERDARLIPFIPSVPQILYLAGIAAAVIGFPVTRDWWRRLRPATPPSPSRAIRWLKTVRDEALFVLVFMPLVGWFAMPWSIILQAYALIAIPFRWVSKLFRRSAA